jgi:hypothetical protein
MREYGKNLTHFQPVLLFKDLGEFVPPSGTNEPAAEVGLRLGKPRPAICLTKPACHSRRSETRAD